MPVVQSARDPGVDVPQTDFVGESLQELGEEMGQVAAEFADVAEKQRSRKASVDLADKLRTFQEDANSEFRRLSDEDDLSNEEVLRGYGNFLATRQQELLDTHVAGVGTPDSTARLQIRFGAVASDLTDKAAVLSTEIGRAKVTDRLDSDLAGLTAMVQRDPSAIDDVISRWDAVVADFTPSLGETEQMTLLDHGRNVITTTVINRTLGGGDVEGAEKQLNSAVRAGLLDADTTASLTSKITDTRLQRNAARFRIAEAEVALGRDLTNAEKLRAFDLAPPASGVTVNVGGGGGAAGALTTEPVKGGLMVRDIDLSLRLLEDMGDVERVILGRIPATDAFTLRTTIESIQGRLAFDNLMSIKRTTGAGLGALSEGELRALSGLAGSLSTDLSKPVLQSNLRDLRNVIAAAETGDEELIKSVVEQAISRSAEGESIPEIGTQEEFDALESGTRFIWKPTGERRRKP